MIFMIPYGAPLYFVMFAVGVIPMAVMLLRGKRLLWYQDFLGLFFLVVIFGGVGARQALAFAAYAAFQVVIALVYFYYRKNRNSALVFYIFTLLSLLPLVLSKVLPLSPVRDSLVGFIGISYLTFKSVQVIIEMRDGLMKDFSPVMYLRFLVFFPTLSAGPIDRFRRFEKDICGVPDREKYLKMIETGIHHIMVGLFYNYIMGYLMAKVLLLADEALAYDFPDVLVAIGYMYVYSLYLFFDFAGYSRFAIGFSYIMGVETPPNFNMPFRSLNIKDFWNRWHMSLSFWFRDFVYMRVLMAIAKKNKLGRVAASNVSYFVLFLLMGLWHGLTWYYIAYGFYHAALICLTDAWIRYKKKRGGFPSNRFTKALARFLTFNAVCFGLLVFSGFLDRFV